MSLKLHDICALPLVAGALMCSNIATGQELKISPDNVLSQLPAYNETDLDKLSSKCPRLNSSKY